MLLLFAMYAHFMYVKQLFLVILNYTGRCYQNLPPLPRITLTSKLSLVFIWKAFYYRYKLKTTFMQSLSMPKQEKKGSLLKTSFKIALYAAVPAYMAQLFVVKIPNALVPAVYAQPMGSSLLFLTILTVLYFNLRKLCLKAPNRKGLGSNLIRGEQRFSSIIKCANDAVVVSDSFGSIVFLNEAAEDMFGYSMAQATGKKLELIIPERYRDLHKKGLLRFVKTGKPRIVGTRVEIEGLRKDGVEFPIELSLASWKTEEGLFFTSIIRDITERREIEEKIKHLAFYDSLTELPNRAMFVDCLEREVDRVKRNKEKLAVMFIDLDRFKNVNDTLGHGVGDSLLKEVARRLRLCIRKHDIAARLGGDEFTILITKTHFPKNAVSVSRRIIEALKPAIEIGDHKVYITPSIGIAVYPENGANVSNLLKNADTAMYCAKEQGRNNYKFCTSDMNEKVSRLMKLETGLCEALEREEFVLHYQPKIDIKTGDILGVEALLRWYHQEKGMIPPEEFIPIAEETGIILEISEWVIQTACKQNKAWQKDGYKPITVAVNISTRHFHSHGLKSLVIETLKLEGLDNKWLELEVTETSVIDTALNAVETLNSLSKLGVRISLDDFGARYSSLSYLKKLPIDTLKIDCSFVSDITTNKDNSAIAKAVIAMAHDMGIKVVAEGIETQQQRLLLSELGCDFAQGYLISRPMPAKELTSLLSMGKPIAPLLT